MDLKLYAIPLLVTMSSILMERWKLGAVELAELAEKYHIFELIANSVDYYNSMGVDGIVEDLEEFIKKQGGSI